MTWEPVLLPLGAVEKTSAVVDAEIGLLEDLKMGCTYIHKCMQSGCET